MARQPAKNRAEDINIIIRRRRVLLRCIFDILPGAYWGNLN